MGRMLGSILGAYVGCESGEYIGIGEQATDAGWELSVGCESLRVLRYGSNAYDWCFDWFHMETYKYSAAENPLGASEGRRKVIRGGSWIARGEFAARCANRAAYEPIRGLHSVGIRIAVDG